MKPRGIKAWAFVGPSGSILKFAEMTGYGTLNYIAIVQKPNEFKSKGYSWERVEIRPPKKRKAH